MPKVIRVTPEPPPVTWQLELTDEEASALRQWLGDSSTAAMNAVSRSLLKIYDALYYAGIKRLDRKHE